MDADGRPTGPVSTVGALREGDEIVRNGRTGAFTFNLAVIKNHSVSVAAHVIEQLELREDGLGDIAVQHPGYHGYVSNPEEANRVALEQCVALEVRRLATRKPKERELLDSRVNESIGSMGDALSVLPAEISRPDRMMRVLVGRVAVDRLNDVSVTPRQIRPQLGIGNADYSED
ncbi:hypothetical protein AB0J03_28725 [Streptomyces microflavus]|uniref:hypothetical protein n=1 Tax=Streptomyces microflavus TaxID=1919 RepID=UPI0033DCB303